MTYDQKVRQIKSLKKTRIMFEMWETKQEQKLIKNMLLLDFIRSCYLYKKKKTPQDYITINECETLFNRCYEKYIDYALV